MTDFAAIAAQLEGQAIELPSWAFGNSGTRFKVFATPGTPRTVQEKLADLADKRYLRTIPMDPITESRETWQIVPPPEGGSGIYDVHSGAQGTASDGTSYAEW